MSPGKRSAPALWARALVPDDACWVSGQPLTAGRYLVRTRHTRKLEEAFVEVEPDATVRVAFDSAQPAVAAGQSVTVYDGVECLGGGIVVQGAGLS